MPDIFQGVAAPDVNTTKTVTTTAPDYYTDYLGGLAGAADTAINKIDPTTGLPVAKTGEDLVAGLDPLQTKGYGQVETAAGSYKPGLTTASETAAKAAGVNASDISNFMNPYTQNVVDEMGRLSQQNVQRNLLPTMKAGFVGSGALGSQRYASGLGQGLADVQSDLTGKQYGALSAGYKSAVDQAIQNAQLENQAAQTQKDIASKEQELGLAGASAMTKAGAEQQAYKQAIIDAPLKNATNAAQLLKGYTIPTTTKEDFTGPIAGVYQNSPLSQISGLGTLLASGVKADKTGWLDRWLASGDSGSIPFQGNPLGESNVDKSSWTDNGDGTFTTTTGQLVDADGNPVN